MQTKSLMGCVMNSSKTSCPVDVIVGQSVPKLDQRRGLNKSTRLCRQIRNKTGEIDSDNELPLPEAICYESQTVVETPEMFPQG